MTAKPATGVDDATLIELGRLQLQLAGNPKTRKQALKLVKEINPSFVMPADIAQVELTETVDQRFAERDANDAAKETKANLERSRKGLLDGTLIEGRKYTEDDVKKIDAFMEANGYTNYEHAALIYAAQQPAARTADMPAAPVWELPKVKNPFNTTEVNNAARAKAFDAIRELRQGTR